MKYLRTKFVSYFFVLGRVLGHFCNVLLYISFVLKQNVAEMSQDASQDEKTRYKTPFLSFHNLRHKFSKWIVQVGIHYAQYYTVFTMGKSCFEVAFCFINSFSPPKKSLMTTSMFQSWAQIIPCLSYCPAGIMVISMRSTKGQLISKCLLGLIVSTKKPTKFL